MHWLERNYKNKKEKNKPRNSKIILTVTLKHKNANLKNTPTAVPALPRMKFVVNLLFNKILFSL